MSLFYFLFPSKICTGGALDRFKNLSMNVYILRLFNLKAAKECEGVIAHDRMSAASWLNWIKAIRHYGASEFVLVQAGT